MSAVPVGVLVLAILGMLLLAVTTAVMTVLERTPAPTVTYPSEPARARSSA